MTGRGIDQVLPHPSEPTLYETAVTSARDYVDLAEARNGRIPRRAPFEYIWGDALAELDERSPTVRVVNLETSATTSPDALPKGINYRMHPLNVRCLTEVGIDCCVLSNNHVMDWGKAGLLETLSVLHNAGIATAGAGRNDTEAAEPAALPLPYGGRMLVFGVASTTSGLPWSWRARSDSPGVSIVEPLSAGTAEILADSILAQRRAHDLVIVSIHWGGNWDYTIGADQQEFAHQLVDRGAADIVHGHSSHHANAIEVYKGRLILYGCGDFINDYEGIAGYETYRPDLGPGLLRDSGSEQWRTRGARPRCLPQAEVPARASCTCGRGVARILA